MTNGAPKDLSSKGPLTTDEDTKLIFGTVFSLRNMIRKLGGDDDKYWLPETIPPKRIEARLVPFADG